MGRKKNIEAIVQSLILIAIDCLLIDAMISKKVNYYVHPRFYVGIWVSIIVLILFTISLISKIRKARHNVNIRHYMIFAIPLVAALLFPATGVNSKDMTIANSDIVASNSEQKKSNSKTDKTTINDTNSEIYDEEDMTNEEASTDTTDATASTQENEQANDTGEETVDISEKYAQYEVDGIMVINDDIFADWYCDVYDNLNEFVGKKCQYLAQVYSMEDFEENQFLAGRYFMVCCAADFGISIFSNKEKSENISLKRR